MAIPKHILRSSPLLLIPLIFLSGATIMLFFCLLAGTTYDNPLNRMWFLQADTSNIPGAPPLSHFTMYNVCGSTPDGHNIDCNGRSAAYPMLPQTYFKNATGVPGDFLRRPNTYYYLSRFSYAFYIISIFWILVALFATLAAIFSYVSTIAATGFALIALLSTAFLAAIMTACYTMARNAFRNAGRFARVGVKTFAFTWTSLVLVFLSLLSLIVTLIYRRRKSRQVTYGRKPSKEDSMGSLLHRRDKRGKYDDEYHDKRASYDSSYYAEKEYERDRGAAGGERRGVGPGPGAGYYDRDYRPSTAGGSGGGGGDATARYLDRAPTIRDYGRPMTAGGATGYGTEKGKAASAPAATGGHGLRRADDVHLNTARYPAPVTGSMGTYGEEQPVRNPEFYGGGGGRGNMAGGRY